MGAEPLRRDDLGALADPTVALPPIALRGDPSRFVGALRDMLRIRLAEETIAAHVATGAVRCPCHLAIGQEAPPVGVSLHLRPTDRSFGAHRSHGHFLAVGGSLRGLFAEVLGKETGVSRGMGGSMHLSDRAHGFIGSVPIVGATIPIAVGAGLAAKMDGTGDIAVAWFGDGATEEGGFHESLNLARNFGLPVLFVCENNLFSSHLHIDLRQPSNSVLRYARAHDVDGVSVDGNDVGAVSDAAERAIGRMRSGGGPAFIECATYRWRGHVGHREDEDVGVKRKDDLALWKRRDPIARLSTSLVTSGVISADHVDRLSEQLATEVAAAWAEAMADPFPDPSCLVGRTLSHSPAFQ